MNMKLRQASISWEKAKPWTKEREKDGDGVHGISSNQKDGRDREKEKETKAKEKDGMEEEKDTAKEAGKEQERDMVPEPHSGETATTVGKMDIRPKNVQSWEKDSKANVTPVEKRDIKQ